MVRMHIDLGNVYSNLGRFDDAVLEFERATNLADPVTDPRTALVARGSIASLIYGKARFRMRIGS